MYKDLNSSHNFIPEEIGAVSWFVHLEKFNLPIHNLCYSSSSLFVFGFLLHLWCCSTMVNYYFEVLSIERNLIVVHHTKK